MLIYWVDPMYFIIVGPIFTNRLMNILENIDFFSIVNHNITLIEWPEIAKDFLPKNYLSLTIETIFCEINETDFNINSQRKITLEHVTKL